MRDLQISVVVTPEISGLPTFVAVGRPIPDGIGASDVWNFRGDASEIAPGRLEDREVVFLGAGAISDLDSSAMRSLGASFARRLPKFGNSVLDIRYLADQFDEVSSSLVALFEGILLGNYRYDALRSKASLPENEADFSSVTVVVPSEWLDAASNSANVAKLHASATALARDLINEPAKTMTPTRFADVATEVAETAGLAIRVWDEEDAKRERLGGLLGVAAGSEQPPRMIRLTYRPSGTPLGKVALVGKGITFDSGGLSLKPPGGMETMKTDMSGAAAVLAAMSVLGALDCQFEVNGYMALTENLPSGTATKPGDVLTTRSGKTIEVLNTDAEGRLVLSDALTLAVEDGAEQVVDLATLTGACVVALGGEIAGIFSNDETLVADIVAAGEIAGEPYWQLPLPKRYRKHIDSEIADMKNMGEPGAAGAIAAALLLQEFVGDAKWAHLDIAGPSRSNKDVDIFAKGGTGFGTRTLLAWLTD